MAIIPKDLYPGQIDESDGLAYPLGKAQNVTAPGDGTGTPWEEQVVNDLFGWQQALLEEAEVTASGSPDEVGASQYLDATKAVILQETEDIRDYLGGGDLGTVQREIIIPGAAMRPRERDDGTVDRWPEVVSGDPIQLSGFRIGKADRQTLIYRVTRLIDLPQNSTLTQVHLGVTPGNATWTEPNRMRLLPLRARDNDLDETVIGGIVTSDGTTNAQELSVTGLNQPFGPLTGNRAFLTIAVQSANTGDTVPADDIVRYIRLVFTVLNI
jgi:hypothetical protein